VKVSGHGLSIDAPAGWEVRIFRRHGAAPVLHLATFALTASDGDFGAAATARMRSDDVFAALVQYRSDTTLRPGVGLFSGSGAPQRLRAAHFHFAQLQVTRRGQLGHQRFFTEAGRPCCLYAVIQPAARSLEQLAGALSRVLGTLAFEG
jgi:hypothetical protein